MHTQTLMAHRPSDREVVRVKQWKDTIVHSIVVAEVQHQKWNDGNKERVDTIVDNSVMQQHWSSSLMRLNGTCCLLY